MAARGTGRIIGHHRSMPGIVPIMAIIIHGTARGTIHTGLTTDGQVPLAFTQGIPGTMAGEVRIIIGTALIAPSIRITDMARATATVAIRTGTITGIRRQW